MKQLLRTLQERKAVQWCLTYLAAAWVLLQVLQMVADQFAWPSVIVRASMIVAATGFLATIAVAWFHGAAGRQRVKGIELGIYAVLLIGAVAGVATVADTPRGGSPTNPRTSVHRQASIAVLPFLDLSAEKNQAWFADGVAEDILNALARIPQLRVVGRTSSFRFRDGTAEIATIGEMLNVAHVLEGSVRRDGNLIRVTAKLVTTDEVSNVVWSQQYDRNATAIFAVQDEITAAILDSLRIKLGVTPKPVQEITTNLSAHEYYLLGMEQWRRRGGEAAHKATSYFQRAIEADSTYSRGHAGLALAYAILPQYDDRVGADTTFPKGVAAARRALRLNPELADAHAALSQIATYSLDPATGIREGREAVRLGASNATAYQWLSEALTAGGRLEESRAAAERATQLDPLSAIAAHTYAMALYRLDLVDAAIAEEKRGISIDPDFGMTYNALAYMHMGANQWDTAHSVWRAMHMRTQKDSAARAWYLAANDTFLAHMKTRAGHMAEVKRLHEWREAAPTESTFSQIAQLYGRIGEIDSAVVAARHLEHSRDKLLIANFRRNILEPSLRGLREDPRLPAVLRPRRI